MSEKEEGAPICPSCNRRDFKLISISDNGKGPKICKQCKKKMKLGLPIERFNRSKIDFAKIEHEMFQKAKQIQEV